jgi:hypothetical protein
MKSTWCKIRFVVIGLYMHGYNRANLQPKVRKQSSKMDTPASRWTRFVQSPRRAEDYNATLSSLDDRMKDRVAKWLVTRSVEEGALEEDEMRELLERCNEFEGLWETDWAPRYGWFFCEGRCARANSVRARYGEYYPDVRQTRFH